MTRDCKMEHKKPNRTCSKPTMTYSFSSSTTIIRNALQCHLLFGTLEKRIEVEREVEREFAREVER
jgi:hypothetical protein